MRLFSFTVTFFTTVFAIPPSMRLSVQACNSVQQIPELSVPEGDLHDQTTICNFLINNMNKQIVREKDYAKQFVELVNKWEDNTQNQKRQYSAVVNQIVDSQKAETENMQRTWEQLKQSVSPLDTNLLRDGLAEHRKILTNEDLHLALGLSDKTFSILRNRLIIKNEHKMTAMLHKSLTTKQLTCKDENQYEILDQFLLELDLSVRYLTGTFSNFNDDYRNDDLES